MTKDPEVSRVNQEVSRRIGEHRRNERIGHTDGGVGVLPRSGYADPRCLRSLDFLAARTMQKWPFDQFRSALDLPDAKGRWQNLNASSNSIKLAPVYSDEKEPYSPALVAGLNSANLTERNVSSLFLATLWCCVSPPIQRARPCRGRSRSRGSLSVADRA